mmetsp:Transcript_55869/g.104825  ORF Transcript_55869/g.104825 Transcript_55869/m.104825 type:complete len:200 (+) Transcript_55869:615-1214(+)
MTSLESRRRSATVSGLVSRCSLISTAPSFLGGAIAMPPKMTFMISRFMASHMIFVRIAPLKPIKEPTTVKVGLPRSMPSATNAQPEYEFSTVMQQGMSPPPTEPTRWTPIAEDRAVVLYMRAVPRPAESVAQNTPSMPSWVAAIPTLSMFLFGKLKGLEPRLPFSLPKAIRLPVKVIPPMAFPSIAPTLCPSAACGWIR